jgi:hypothetical protein
MKKIILLLFSILPFCIFAQVSNISLDFCNPEYPISYNKKDKSEITETKNKYVKFGETVNFTIKNVNTQLYTVTIDGENITYKSEISAAFKIFTAATTVDETEASVSVVDTINRTNGANFAPNEDENRIVIVANKYIGKYNAFKNKVKNLEDLKTIYLQLQSFSQSEIDATNTTEYIKSKSKTIIQKFRNDENIFDQISVLKTAIDDAKMEEEEAYNNLPKIDATRKEKLQKQVAAVMNNAKSLADINALNKINPEDDDDVQLLKRASDLHQKAASLNQQVNDFDYTALGKQVIKLYASIKNSTNYEVSSAPIQADGDDIEFTFKVAPKTNLDFASPTKEIKKTYLKIWVKGGCQFKFGVGLGMNTIGLFNSSFTLNTRDSIVDTITGSKVGQVLISRDKNRDWFIPNGVAYAHFLSRVARFVSVGGSVGVNVDFKDVKSSGFNIGFTTAFGNKYSVAFTVGASFGSVEKLNGKYETNKLYKQAEVDATALTKTAFRCGLFFGLSLNLTSTEIRR